MRERRQQERRQLVSDWLRTERRRREQRQKIANAKVLAWTQKFYETRGDLG